MPTTASLSHSFGAVQKAVTARFAADPSAGLAPTKGGESACRDYCDLNGRRGALHTTHRCLAKPQLGWRE